MIQSMYIIIVRNLPTAQSSVEVMYSFGNSIIVFGSNFIASCLRHLVDYVIVKGSSLKCVCVFPRQYNYKHCYDT